MEEDGNTYLAEDINDPDAKLIDMNCEQEDDWQIIHF